MNENTRKIYNTVFRIVIFICFIMSVIMVINLISFIIIMDKDDPGRIDDFISAINSFTGLYKIVFIGTCAALILSIISKYRCKKKSIVFRTIFLLILTVAMVIGLKVNNALNEVTDVLDKMQITDLNKVTKQVCIDAGITPERATELAETLNANDSLGAVMSMTIAIFVSAILYFILSITSLHNLLKKDTNSSGGAAEYYQY
jgi:glucan phosphoethanolaminetransferase (alkaline phosphatase superfamily)